MTKSNKRVLILMGISIFIVIAIFIFPSISQDKSYHLFADTRSFMSIPNFMDVITNLAFLFVGIQGLYLLSQKSRTSKIFQDNREKIPYLILFVGMTFTAFGSGYYHYFPNNSTLFWDRLPMTLLFMSYFSAFIMERISVKVGIRLLLPLLGFGVFSVWYWSITESMGSGDLRPYIIVQFCPLILIFIITFMFPSKYQEKYSALNVVLIYAIAKILELQDSKIFNLGYIISGHSIKHIVAALAIYHIYRVLRKRRILKFHDKLNS